MYNPCSISILGSKNQYQCSKKLCTSKRREFNYLQFNQHHFPVQVSLTMVPLLDISRVYPVDRADIPRQVHHVLNQIVPYLNFKF